MLHTGRHFLQIPGPTNVPDRVLRAMDRPVIDHRGPEFAQLGAEVLEGVKSIFKTSGPVVIYPSSGSGAWEAAIVNTLSPGDRVLMFETGHFSNLWRDIALRHGLQVDYVPGNWRRGAQPADAEQRHDAGVTPGLRQNALPRIDQKHRKVAGRGARRHVAGVLLVAGRIGDDELAFRGGEIAVGDIDRDALLALRLQPVDQQGEIEITAGRA